MIKILTHRPGARFSKVPKSFSKISDLLSTELSYLYVPNKNRGSLQTESFRRMRLSVFKCWLTKNCLFGPERIPRAFEKRVPGLSAINPLIMSYNWSLVLKLVNLALALYMWTSLAGLFLFIAYILVHHTTLGNIYVVYSMATLST